jgi:hypothetical protein
MTISVNWPALVTCLAIAVLETIVIGCFLAHPDPPGVELLKMIAVGLIGFLTGATTAKAIERPTPPATPDEPGDAP